MHKKSNFIAMRRPARACVPTKIMQKVSSGCWFNIGRASLLVSRPKFDRKFQLDIYAF